MTTSVSELLRSFEKQIADDKAAHRKGWARVRFSHLSFSDPIRGEDEKIIARLKRNIASEGCHDEEHPIPAVIDEHLLETALISAGIQLDSLTKAPINHSPKLRFSKGTKLNCLQGQHRVLAAKQVLSHTEKWWTIELYGEGLSNDARQSLRNGFSYSASYTDGEIFRQIRHCQLTGDKLGESRWMAQYSRTKERDFKQLLNREILLRALDSILPIKGLWAAFHAGSLDIILTSRFDEEISKYITSIKEVFNWILDGDILLMERTDEGTVEAIQLRAPALSSYDADFIKAEMKSQKLFPEILDSSIRSRITSRLLAIEQLIPSIYTLFKNLRYMQPALGMIKNLIPKKMKGTLREALYFHFSEAESAEGSLEIQESERSYSTFSGSCEQFFDLAVRQLFIYAIRHSAKPKGQSANIYSNFGLAELAVKLGFSSRKIDLILKDDPYQRMVLDLLHHMPSTREASKIQVQPIVTELRELVNALSNTGVERSAPWATVPGLGEPLSRRCGPAVWALPIDGKGGELEDQAQTFLKQMQTPLTGLQRGGEGISSFYVKQSIYLAFFGVLTPDENWPAHSCNSEKGPEHITPSTSHRQPVEQPAASGIGLSFLDANSSGPSHGPSARQIGQVITFMENGAPVREVPYEKGLVNFQAREYADQGKKLHLAEGPHFIWQDCFDILTRTRTSTVFISTVIQPLNGKRRNGQNLPDQFQPATKEAFEFNMEDEEQL